MSDLRQLMHEAVDHRCPDHVVLAARARVDGAALRRRHGHRRAVAGGSFAVLLLLAVTAGGRLLLDRAPRTVTGASAIAHPGLAPAVARLDLPFENWAQELQRSGPLPWRSAHPRSGRELTRAVEAVYGGGHRAPWNISVDQSYRDRSHAHHPAQLTASLTLRSETGVDLGQVSASWTAEDDYVGSGGVAATRQWLVRCDASTTGCRTSTLPDGSLLRTSTYRMQTASGSWEMNVAERDVDGVVEQLVAFSSRDARSGSVDAEAPLSTEQLASVVAVLRPLT